MSNELAVIKFKNGDVFFSAYHGCGSEINSVLRDDVESVLSDPFPEPERNEWLANANEGGSPTKFYSDQDSRVYDVEDAVEVYTPYGGGEYWMALASRSAMRISSGHSIDFSNDGQPDWAKGLLPALRTRL